MYENRTSPFVTAARPSRTKKTSNIEIYYQNVRGLRTKLNQFFTNIECSGSDIFAITETGCNDSIDDAEIVPPGFQILRCDRTDGRKHGGVFLAAAPGLELRKVNVTENVNIDNCVFEIVGASIYLNNVFLFFCSVIYIPPNSNDNEFMILFRILENWCIKYDSCLVIGDFNLYSSSDNVINYFEYFTAFCDFAQRNEVRNCNDRILDLVLISLAMDEVGVCPADEELVPRDEQHPPLAVTVRRAPLAARIPPSTPPPRPDDDRQWNFSKADYHALYSSIAAADWNNLYAVRDPEETLDIFYGTLTDIFDRCIPKRHHQKKDSRYQYPKWYTADIIKAIKMKAGLHRQYKVSGSNYAAFSECRARVKRMIEEAHTQYRKRVEHRLIEDPKSFWNFVRAKRGTVNRKQISLNGRPLSEPDCAVEFAKFFHSVYGTSTAILDVAAAEAASPASAARVHVPHLTLAEVRAALTRLKPKRSAGPDGIPVFIMRDCRMALAEPLAHIYNRCLGESHFPERWKTTRVIPIPKGSGSDVTEFRPVAILSTAAKVFESAVQRSMQEQVSARLSDAQHGFRPAHSTSSNLLDSMNYVLPYVDAGVQVDAAYFDFKKAFDLVDNDILLQKLATIGCTTKLLQFFASYMKDRRQYVDYAGWKSESYSTLTGVSQGSNLGPLEFIIMINDLPTVIKDAKCLLFADDLKLLLPIIDEEDCRLLQRDVDRVVEWTHMNDLQFNVSKCSIITFSRAKSPLCHNYQLKGSQLKRVSSVRDLGVNLDNRLHFRGHVIDICKKAFKSLGFILRQTKSFTNMHAVRTLYDALVRSHLEFNSAVWAPHEVKYSQMVERIQNKFTRCLYFKLYGIYPFYPLMYPTLFVIGMVGYNKLEVRRDAALALYLVKVLRGLIANPGILMALRLNVPEEYVHRRRRPALLSVPRGKTNLLNKAPLTRGIHTLNLLAERVDIFCCSMSEVQRALLFILCYLNKG